MNILRHRRHGLPALALLISVAGCSSADDSADVAVPTPDAKTARLCRNLHKALPRQLDGRDRGDPEPRSALTAGWGSPAIILRCGVTRPAKMIDPKVARGDDPNAVAGTVNGVDWLMEKSGGVWRFTTANREVYVQLTLPKGMSAQEEGAGVLTDMAPAVKKAIPTGIASMS